MTANSITLLSTGCIVALLMITWVGEGPGSCLQAFLIAFFLHAYVVGDHLDGMQAKIRGTSSPLGEYLDHYLDVFNGAIVLFVVVDFFEPVPAAWFFFLLGLNCLAFAATMVEELERGYLVFSYLGTLEGLLLLILFFLSWLIPPARAFWQNRVFWDWPLYQLIWVGMGIGYAGTLADILARLKRVPGPFAWYGLGLCLLVYSLYRLEIGYVESWLLVVLYSAEYIGKVMGSYLLSQPHRCPDWMATAAAGLMVLMVFFRIPFLDATSFRWLLTLYLAAKVLCGFFRVVYSLRRYWYWLNP